MSQFIEMFSKYSSETPWYKLLTIINGKAYPEEYNNIGTYPICGSAGIMYYGERKLCDANTIILGRKGNINHPIYMESDYWIVDTAFCLDVNKSILHPKYFYYWCCQYDFTKLNKQGVLPSLTRKDLEKIEMSVPPMVEQKKFVSIVEQADKSKFGDFKSQFIEMFGNPLFNTKKWKWYSNINNVVTIVLGSTPNTKEPKYWDGDIKWVTPAEMDDETFMINDTLRHITEFGVKSANLTKLPIGSVLFSTRAPIGKVGIAAAEMYCNQGFKSFICSNQVDSIFLYYTLKLNKEYLCSLGTGTTFKELSKKTVEGLKLGVPPIDLQKQFAIIYKQADKSKSYVWTALKNLESMLGYYIRQVA